MKQIPFSFSSILSLLIIVFLLFNFGSSHAQTVYNNNNKLLLNDCEIMSSDSVLCEGESSILNINFPMPDSSSIIAEQVKDSLYSGLGDWNFTDSFLIINYSKTYGLPGMMIYGDSSQNYGAIEAEVRQTEVGPEANVGVAMAVNPNNYDDEHLYNGPGSYFLAISGDKVELYNGIWNTPMGYSSGPIASKAIAGLQINTWNKVKLEILPDAHVYGYVNDSLYIDYEISDEKIPTGYFALVTSNSHNEYRKVSSYYFPIDIFWSTGDTTRSITVEPVKSKDYTVVISGANNKIWTDTISITVNQIANIVEYVSICEGERYKDWDETGQYNSTFQSISGCDSFVTTILTVNQKYKVTENITICEGDSYKDWTTEGQHQEILKSVFGCDSTTITNLSFYPIFHVGINVNKDTLISDINSQIYQWYNEDKGKIEGATENNYIVTESGKYYFITEDNNGCSIESNSITIVYSSSDLILIQDFKYSIIPNPNNGHFRFRVESKPKEDFTLKLINPIGQVIDSRGVQQAEPNHFENFEFENLSKGMYLLIITSDGVNVSEKIIVH